jgi:predicted peptidase
MNLRFHAKSYEPEDFTGGTIFLMAAFGTKAWYYKPVVQVLLQNGFRVHVYDYLSKPLLDAHPEEWVVFNEQINIDLAQKIKTEKKRYNGARFGIIGASVGSMLAIHAAKIYPELERIMLVTVYGSSARHVWESPKLTKVRDKFEATHRGMDEAYNLFGHMEATYQLNLIGKRKILLFANERDKVIKFENTKLLIEEAKRLGLQLRYRRVRSLRHSTTLLKVFRNEKEWIPFFMTLKHVPKSGDHQPEHTVG